VPTTDIEDNVAPPSALIGLIDADEAEAAHHRVVKIAARRRAVIPASPLYGTLLQIIDYLWVDDSATISNSRDAPGGIDLSRDRPGLSRFFNPSRHRMA